jgi:hypothetical protein
MVTLALKMLERKEFIVLSMESGYREGEYSTARVTDTGWIWLESNMHIFDVKPEPKPSMESVPASPDDDMPF